jgi:HlyD family secretion protein
MANLADMQVRTLVDETDMGDLESGLEAAVRVEAYPDRTFRGVVDKIEPQATVDQNVTMFPVIVSIDNRAGLLRPGMNAEVEISIDEALDVIMVPNNAVVQTTDVGPAALALGLSLDDVDLSQFMRAGRGGFAAAPGGRTTPDAAEASPEASSSEGAPDAGTATPAMQRIQELRAQASSGEITQDSLRNAIAALRQSGQAVGFRPGAAGADAAAAPARESRPAAVFVLGADSIPEPRLIQIGIGDWDNTQVVSGLDEGQTLVIVGAAQLQAQQQEFLNRMRSRSGGSPFGGGPRGRR